MTDSKAAGSGATPDQAVAAIRASCQHWVRVCASIASGQLDCAVGILTCMSNQVFHDVDYETRIKLDTGRYPSMPPFDCAALRLANECVLEDNSMMGASDAGNLVAHAVAGFGPVNGCLVSAAFRMCVDAIKPKTHLARMTLACEVMTKAKNAWVQCDSNIEHAAADGDDDDCQQQRQRAYDGVSELIIEVFNMLVMTADDEPHEDAFDEDMDKVSEMCDPFDRCVRGCIVRLVSMMLRTHTVVPVGGRPDNVMVHALTRLADRQAAQEKVMQGAAYMAVVAISKLHYPWPRHDLEPFSQWLTPQAMAGATKALLALLQMGLRGRLVAALERHRCELADQDALLVTMSGMAAIDQGEDDEDDEEDEEEEEDDDEDGDESEHLDHPGRNGHIIEDRDSILVMRHFDIDPQCLAQSHRTDFNIVTMMLGLNADWYGTKFEEFKSEMNASDTPQERQRITDAIDTVMRKYQERTLDAAASTVGDYVDRCVRVIFELLLANDNAFAIFYYAIVNYVVKCGTPTRCTPLSVEENKRLPALCKDHVEDMIGVFACQFNHGKTVGVGNYKHVLKMVENMQQALGAAFRDASANSKHPTIVLNLGLGESHTSAIRHHEALHGENTKVITCEFNTWVMGRGDNRNAMQRLRDSVMKNGLHLLPFNIEMLRLPADLLRGCTLAVTSWYANNHVSYGELLRDSAKTFGRVFCLSWTQEISGLEPCVESQRRSPRVTADTQETLDRIESALVRSESKKRKDKGKGAATANGRRKRKRTKAESRLGL